ncbi:MAG: Rpn family recombination-promoting nuclease/putative transposase [Micrococcales bacterium]|nr:Rpn family recombination-promoting nuclease/putative transposase [Micrococcales bacterium]
MITGFDMVTTSDHYHHVYRLTGDDHGDVFSDVLQIHILELSKLKADDGTPAWAWLRLIAATTDEELTMAAGTDPDMNAAATLVRRFSADETARHELESREKFLWDQQAAKSYAHDEGREEGREEGLEQAARNALRLGMTVDQAAAISGMEPSKVAALQGTTPAGED